MSPPVLVLITGPPCTGKTTLGRRLAQEFTLPFFYKDGFKEIMYDVIGEREGIGNIPLELSRTLGLISIRCLQSVMEEMLSKNLSLIVEANFDRVLFSPFVQELQATHRFHTVQVQMKCDGPTLLERFIRRESAGRHPGHQGLKHLEATRAALLRGQQEPLAVEGDLLIFDTTDFTAVNYDSLLNLLNERLRC